MFGFVFCFRHMSVFELRLALVGSGGVAGVGSGVVAGVGSGVGAGVGSGVGAGVGSGVVAGVGSGVGSCVGSGVGSGVGFGVGFGVGSGGVSYMHLTLPTKRLFLYWVGRVRTQSHSVEAHMHTHDVVRLRDL